MPEKLLLLDMKLVLKDIVVQKKLLLQKILTEAVC